MTVIQEDKQTCKEHSGTDILTVIHADRQTDSNSSRERPTDSDAGRHTVRQTD